ncbi:BTAD domain-containing putative transcriptional regulator [Streptomyces mirabilis]|uniref:BTAD domain-containing putative transcriptional regulator n=1 Tax=Streptomyces mirabilis TaxID=68239 RepID=UPI0033ABAC5E
MPRRDPARRTGRRLTAAVRFLTCGSALAAAVAGIPYVLVIAVGAPWPGQVTSFDDLAGRLGQPISDPFVFKVLALVGWACWTYFTATVMREALWLLRRLPALVGDAALLRRRTATLPAHRAAAALLVGTLLIALIGLWRLPVAHATVPATNPAAEPVAAVAPLHVPPARAAEPGHATYIVQPGDTLWDIAEQHLGDPLLWPKIYQLSCAVRQSDGRLLSDPDLIMPGWRLHLPVNEAPAPRPPRPSAETPAQPPHPSNPAPEPEGNQPSGRGQSGDEQRQTDPQQQDHRRGQEQRPVAIGLGIASTIGVTTAAGIAAAIGFARWHAARRRTPRVDALAAPLEDDDLLLGDALHRSNQAHLATRAARHHNPEDLPRRTAPAEPGQPGTVTVAEHAGREVRIDALAISGGVQLAGPGAESAARHLAMAIAGAAQRLRPAPPSVRLVVPQATLHRLLPGADEFTPAWRVTETAAEALETAEHALLEHVRHEQHLDTEPLAHGMPALYVLLVDGADQDPVRLQALAARATPGQLAVVALGPIRASGHRLTVAADGSATGSLAALPRGVMFLLAPEAASEILDTLHAAHGRQPAPPESGDEPEEPEPASAPTPSCESPSTRTAKAEPGGAAPTRTVHIRLFGGFRIFVDGKECTLADTRKEETREFIALLAAHRDGLRGEEIAEKMQLADDPDEAKGEIENLRRAARRVFRGATGKKEVAFVALRGQVHRLDPQYISTDVAAFTDALKQATSADSPYARAEALQHATDVYAGPLCDGADYLWAHGLRTALHRRALDALMLLAEHTAQHSADAEPALALLNRAADLDPENERVYRRIIQLQLVLGRDDAAHRTLGLLTERLAGIDAEPEPGTLALLHESRRPAHRVPGRGQAARR